jgi:hypothetical protein
VHVDAVTEEVDRHVLAARAAVCGQCDLVRPVADLHGCADGWPRVQPVGEGSTQVRAPFDARFRDYMVETTARVMNCGFRVTYGYTQSDEMALLFHPDEEANSLTRFPPKRDFMPNHGNEPFPKLREPYGLSPVWQRRQAGGYGAKWWKSRRPPRRPYRTAICVRLQSPLGVRPGCPRPISTIVPAHLRRAGNGTLAGSHISLEDRQYAT